MVDKEKKGGSMRQVVEYNPVALVHYKAGFLAFGCFDARFQVPFSRLVEHFAEGDKHQYIDQVIFAGGACDLADSGTAEQRALFSQIEKSVALHQTPALVLTTHEDCGRLGEEAKCGGDRQAQFLFHVAKHREIEKAVLTHFPAFAGHVRHFYLSINGAIEMGDLNVDSLSDSEVVALALAV